MRRGPGWPAKTRGPSKGSGGSRHHRSISTLLIMSRGPGRPVKTLGPPHGLNRAANVKPAFHGPRPGLAHQISSQWAATRPGPSNFQVIARGPARSITFLKLLARPDPAHHIFKTLGPAQPGHHVFKMIGPARPAPSGRDKPWLSLYTY